jgi:hypothetical protein
MISFDKITDLFCITDEFCKEFENFEKKPFYWK